MLDFREYENGIADVLSFIVGERAIVERNVEFRGRSGSVRQVDVVVRGHLLGRTDATLAVDCKRLTRRLTITQADTFIGFFDDLGCDFGLLVASSGYSDNARDRLLRVFGTRVAVVTPGELGAWRPRDTIFVAFRVSAGDAELASATLRLAGLRVQPTAALTSDGVAVLEAFCHSSGTADEQRALPDRASLALATAGVPVDLAASGTVIDGGTPAHAWLEVTLAGGRAGLKVLADSEDAAREELDRVASMLGAPRDLLDIERPAGWPLAGLFGLGDPSVGEFRER
jgi:hypothetical protein